MTGIFDSLFDTGNESIDIVSFASCVICALVVGFLIAAMYSYKNNRSEGFATTIALIPAIVTVVILAVNGNIGTGIAVAGAFSLVRFRSAPGTAKEIGVIFLAMSTGLLIGTGYLAYSVLFALIIGAVMMLCNITHVGKQKNVCGAKNLNITIPEDLDYYDLFDDIFTRFTSEHELMKVKTSNMGSMYRLTYKVKLKEEGHEKEMMDLIRCRNGNLEVSLFTAANESGEL